MFRAIAILFLFMGMAMGPATFADVPPEILRLELADDESLALDINAPLLPGTSEYEDVINDPWLGYRLIAIVDKSAQGTTPSAQSLSLFAYQGPTLPFRLLAVWAVSTGLEVPQYRDGNLVSIRTTRVGFHRAEYLNATYVSRKYGEAMPFSIFYDREFGVAIHATKPERYANLGKRASHGCTRLTLENAKAFYDLTMAYGQTGVVKLDRKTGEAAETALGPLVLRSYPLMVINTEPGNPNSPIQIDPVVFQSAPERLAELLPSRAPESRRSRPGQNLASLPSRPGS